MSIKIYTGFILRATTLESALDRVQTLRRETNKLARVRMARSMGRKCAAGLDRYAARDLFPKGGTIPRLESPMSSTWMEVMDEYREAQTNRRRHPETDFEFTMTLHPDNGDILGMSFVEEDDWHRHWMKTEGVEDYCYYNNSDRPEGVDQAEWEERARRWDRVVDRDPASRPAYAGLTANIHESEPPVVPVDEVLPYLPDFETRARKLAFEIMHSHAMTDLYAKVGEDIPTSQIVGVLYQLKEHLETEEGRAERDAMVAKLKKRLMPEFTREILIEGLPE